MGRITLLGTSHRASGKCNEHELGEILLSICPEVIFQEIRSNDFESFYEDESKYNVEMRAIKKYLKRRNARQISVDDYLISEGLGPYMLALDEFVKSRSGAYRDVMEDIHHQQFELGFTYLNSSAFASRIRESEQLYQEVVFKYGNDLAKGKLSEWNDLVRNRDASMLENIYRFCQQTDFTEGVFLVGASHMSSIIDGIGRRMKDQPNLVTWKFWNGPWTEPKN